MSVALEHFVLANADDIDGIISAGGSGGTALVTPAMRALPVGVPKVMVSTVASGNVGSYGGPSDIAMMYSVTDVAGLTDITYRAICVRPAESVVAILAGEAPNPNTVFSGSR